MQIKCEKTIFHGSLLAFAYLGGRRTDSLCSKLSFQGCWCSEQPWKIQLLEQRAGVIITHYKIWVPQAQGCCLVLNPTIKVGAIGPSLHHPVRTGGQAAGGRKCCCCGSVASAIALSHTVLCCWPRSLRPSSTVKLWQAKLLTCSLAGSGESPALHSPWH